MPQMLRSEVDLPRAWSSGISTLTVIIAVSVVPPDIVAGGPMGACRRFLSVQLASPFLQLRPAVCPPRVRNEAVRFT
jgi:hypothetical protein